MSGPLQEAAIDAQDGIGWAPFNDHGEMASAVLELARVVVTLAGEIDRLKTQVNALTMAEA